MRRAGVSTVSCLSSHYISRTRRHVHPILFRDRKVSGVCGWLVGLCWCAPSCLPSCLRSCVCSFRGLFACVLSWVEIFIKYPEQYFTRFFPSPHLQPGAHQFRAFLLLSSVAKISELELASAPPETATDADARRDTRVARGPGHRDHHASAAVGRCRVRRRLGQGIARAEARCQPNANGNHETRQGAHN